MHSFAAASKNCAKRKRARSANSNIWAIAHRRFARPTAYSPLPIRGIHSINEVLKTKAATIHPQKVITVTRPGGKILIEGLIVNAVDRSFKPLAVGANVLLFLKYLPATDSYQAVNNKSSFELLNNKVKPLSDASDAKKQRGDLTSFLGDIRAAIASNGEAKGGR